MNDRFKFRVWNKLTHSFTTGGAIKFGGLCFVDEEDFGIKLGEHQECYIIEQCTGLKDKNGNLIYEGDIIKCGNATGVVKFGFYRKADEHFANSIYGFYIEWEKQCSFRQDFGYWITEERIEIVGNIHTGIKGE